MKRVIANGSCPTKDWQQTSVTISIKKSCDLSAVSLFLPVGHTDFEKNDLAQPKNSTAL
ncbi:hypothetical protein SAMD00079811_41080 [Scytonema sp. HK-05]|uniref:hypothetical protein n=1 Tax=Scytonema sp. HK-05 TaxID=1137095 RepID=UPI000AD740BA|nr:hypothetical protein [Scytonema sp. HK-05]BAY46496.1 hypothetical protein SAMD00079811_41080 [Scytonema sp. HK-05]